MGRTPLTAGSGLIARLFLALAACLAVATTGTRADTLTVGKGGAVADLAQAVRASDMGDTLRLLPGTYEVHDLKIPHDLTLVGEGEVILTASRPVAKGLLVPLSGTAITVRGLIFEGARSRDDNGAGIRFEGTRLTVEDSIFRNNENGILATGDENGTLRVVRSAFIGNGHGDGYSHGIYQSSGGVFDIQESRFDGTRVGHHLKTLAKVVVVRNNTFDDGDGETSYVLDVTAGGRIFVENNRILRRASAGQQTLINYDTSRGGEPGELTITGNAITTEKGTTHLLRNPERAPVEERGNVMERTGRRLPFGLGR